MKGRDSKTGPRGGITTVAPSGWQKTTVYLRREQIRTLKQTALDRDRTMSEVLRHAIDHYFGLIEGDARLTEHQREVLETILRDQVNLEPARRAQVLEAFDSIEGPENEDDDPDKRRRW